MLYWDDNTKNKLKEIHTGLKKVLSETNTFTGDNWLDLYSNWKDDNSFEFIIYFQDGFNESPPKEILYYDSTDPYNQLFFDDLSMSIFISRSFVNYARKTVKDVINENHPDNKIEIIQEYFKFIKQRDIFEPAVTLLYKISRESGVVQGDHPVDIAPAAYSLYETLEMYSVDTIFLLFTYWRITSDTEYLKKMSEAITKYIRTYYKENGKNPEMHLDWPIENESIIQQINILSLWIETICYDTKSIIEEYKQKKWFNSVDRLVDDLSFPPFISYFEMMKYKDLFPEEENSIVHQKASYYHSYGVWIKTVDVIEFLSQAAQILYNKNDDEIEAYGVRRAALLELADNLKKMKDYFSNLLFTHKEFYDSMRKKYSFLVLETYEQNARKIDSSLNDLIQFTDGVLSNNIDALMQSKQQFVSKISGFISTSQKQSLDEYMTRVIDKLKEEIKKLNVYTILYEQVTEDFKKYSSHLLMYPDIFCSLVSAEYLYSQYIENKQPNEKFDYSCISILYYMALEDFANKLLYTSYATNVLDNEATKATYAIYVSSPTKYWDAKNHCYKKTCEIGNLGHLFKAVQVETKYKEYLQNKYPQIDIPALSHYGDKLINIASRRNDAAHGGNLLSYSDASNDKQLVYDDLTHEYRGLILELFSIIFSE